MAETPHPTDSAFERENERAIRHASEADRIEPRAATVCYDPARALIVVELRSGVVFGFPPERIPGLGDAGPKELSSARISPSGDGIHWDDLDAHASLTGLVVDALNLREWAPRIMGQIRSGAKARAARANGLKGGRPRKSGESATRKE